MIDGPHPLESLLRAVQWAYEREEETARLYHGRAELLLAVVGAFVGLGLFKGAESLTSLSPAVESWFIAFVILSGTSIFLAAFFVLIGHSREEHGHVSASIAMSNWTLEELGTPGSDQGEVFADLVAQVTFAHRTLAARNEERRRDLRTGYEWLVFALGAAAVAGIVFWSGQGSASSRLPEGSTTKSQAGFSSTGPHTYDLASTKP